MGSVRAGIGVPGPAADAQALWLDPQRWANIIEDFRVVDKQDPGWPREGRIVWHSTPHGRGRVVEQMVAYDAGVEHVTEVEDERIRGTQRVTFTEKDGMVHVVVLLEYALKDTRPVMKVTDLLFIRRSMRDALRRNLRRYAAERVGDVSP
jgi:hypothetical protein